MLLPVFGYSRASTQPIMGCEITGSHFDKERRSFKGAVSVL